MSKGQITIPAVLEPRMFSVLAMRELAEVPPHVTAPVARFSWVPLRPDDSPEDEVRSASR